MDIELVESMNEKWNGGVQMNWLILFVLAILIFYAYTGVRRGLIKTVFVMFSTIVALILTGMIAPNISKSVQKNDKIIALVSENIEKVIDFSDMGSKTSEEVDFIDKLTLPSSMKNALLENNTVDMYKAMAVNNFKSYISNYLTRTMINAVVFIFVFFAIKIGLMVLSKTLDLISKLPILNGLNKTAGLIAGLLHGTIIIWIGCIIINIFISTSLGQYMYGQISSSVILSLIYNNNLLLRFVINVGGLLF